MTWRWFDCMSNTYHNILEDREMPDNELIEAYFVVRGWKFVKESPVLMKEGFWYNPDDIDDRAPGFEQETYTNLPNILDSYPAFKEHVLEVMENDGYKLEVDPVYWEIDWFCMEALTNKNAEEKGKSTELTEEIIDNNILHAAVISATRYFESKEVAK